MTIKIKEPWWGAWKRFGWNKGIWGVGIKKKDIEKSIKEGVDITINVLNGNYTVVPSEAKDYCKENMTVFLAKNNTLLYVLPRTFLLKRSK